MGYPTTNAEIVNDALFRAGELTDGSSDYEQKALDYLNRVYLAIAAGGSELNKDVNEKWWWLRSDMPSVITLLPIETGTFQVTKGSADVVFNIAPTISLQGRFLRTRGTQDMFRISSHIASDTAATLDSVYTGPTSLAEQYDAAQMEYAIPSTVMEVLSPMRAYQDSRHEIIGMDAQSMEDAWPLSQAWHGVPQAFAHVGTSKLRFSHQGGSNSELIRVDFDYLVRPTELAKDNNECLVPPEYRKTLSDFVCMFILVDKDDNKAQDIGGMARGGLAGMATENRRRGSQISKHMGRIFARPLQMDRNRYPLRTTGGRIIR